MSSLDPVAPDPKPDPEPETSAGAADPQTPSPADPPEGDAARADSSADTGSPEGEALVDDEDADDEELDDDEDADDAGGDIVAAGAVPPGTGRSRLGARPRGRNRLARYLTAALVVALAFESGILVGRATAPDGGTAPAPSLPAGSEANAGASASPASSSAPGASSPLDGLPSDGPLLGSVSAKVQLTYWADFQCPFCARFAQDVLPQLAPLIADGTVSVRHRDFVFLGPESLDAAVAVECAGEQGRYWQMHDAVYAAQNGENQGTFSTATLTRLAAGVGADTTAFTACTQRQDVLVEVLSDTSAGVRAGVTSTPTIDIPGRTFQGLEDASTLIQAIEQAAKAGTAPTPAPSVQPSGDPWAGTATSGRTAGSASAPVTVELWVDYQATGMPAVVQSLEPELRTRIASGKVQVVLRDLATLGDESVTAASFIRCGAQSGEATVWFAHDILSVSAQGANKGVFTTRGLLWLAAKLGWDVAALDRCMSDPATASAIQAETATGTQMGLTAAPAVVVNSGGKEVARFSGSSLDAAKVIAAVDAAAK